MVIPVLLVGSEWAVSAHEALSRKPLGAGKSCSELTTPGARTVPTREKDLSLESIFHIHMTPSHEPGEWMSRCSDGGTKALGMQKHQNIAEMQCYSSWCLDDTFGRRLDFL